MKILIVLCALATLTFAEGNGCYDPNPKYCEAHKDWCDELGWRDMMRRVCPRTCGVCHNEESSDVQLDAQTYNLDEILKQCIQDRKECMKHHGRRGQCTLRYALCALGKVVVCGRSCLIPFINCERDVHGDAKKQQECADGLESCIKGHCGKSNALAVAPKDEEIVKQCQSLFHECSTAASGIIQKGECLVQLGLCMAAKLVDCAKDCVAPMLMCKGKSLGSFRKLLQCNIDFVKCAVGGCANSTILSDDYSPYAAAIAHFEANGDIIDECRATHADCMKTAVTGRAKIQCFIHLGLCIGTKAAGCAAQCVAPLVMCRISSGGSWAALLKCAQEFLSCTVAGCTKAIASDDDYSPFEAAIAEFEENGSIIEECKVTHVDCMKAAITGRQKIKCFIQLGLCIGARAVGCAKQCIAPLIMCRITAGGSWPALLNCGRQFLQCTMGGCTQASTDVAVASNDEIIAQCQSLYEDCRAAASGIIQKGKCIVQLGLCMAAKLVDCSKDCVAPMLLCKSKAIGSFQKLLQCNIDFVKCAVGGCANSTSFVSDDDYSPYEAALAQFEENGSIIEECKITHVDCMKSAVTGREKIQCFIQLGLCIGTKAVACAKQCVIPLVMCRMTAGGSWPALMKCAKEFLSCTVAGCTKELAYTPFEAAVAEFEEETLIPECKAAHEVCMKAIKGNEDKMKCVSSLGVCLGKRIMNCAKSCVPSLMLCRLLGGGSWPAMLKCGKEFLTCTVTSCIKVPTAVSVVPNDVTAECQSLFEECRAAASGIIQKGECIVQLGLCMAAKLVDCSKDCVAPMLLCKAKAIGSFQKLLQCNIDFVKCAVGGCANKTISNEVAVNGPIETIAQVCTMMHEECVKLAWTPIQKLICFNLHLACVGIKAVGCAKDCIPPLLKCKLWSIGRIFATIKCYKDFIHCGMGGCMNGTAIAPPTAVMAMNEHDFSPYEMAILLMEDDTGLSLDTARCKALLSKCTEAAGGIQDKVECFIRFGTCLGKEAVGCSAHCIPQFALCKYNAQGNWIKTSLCALKFLYCAKKGCMTM